MKQPRRLDRLALSAACVAVAVLALLSLVDSPLLPSSGALEVGDVVTLRHAGGEYEVLGRDESGLWVVEGRTGDTGNVLGLVDVYDIKAVVSRADSATSRAGTSR